MISKPSVNGIFFALRTGIPWRDMPDQYGSWSTIYNRFNRWSKSGMWDMISDAIMDSHNVGIVMVDATSIRDHPSAAKLKKPTNVVVWRALGAD